MISYLHDALQQPLPGEDAHFKMAPYRKIIKDQLLSADKAPRLSAVLVLFYPKNEVPHIVLMKRPEYDGTHSGQVSFPGGKMEESDNNLEATARREAEEETGILGASIRMLGKLTELYIPPSGFMVSPYVGYLNETPSFVPDDYEVAELIEMPVSDLLDDSIIGSRKIHLKSKNIHLTTPCFNVNGHVVWGATCMMLSELKEILKLQQNYR